MTAQSAHLLNAITVFAHLLSTAGVSAALILFIWVASLLNVL